MTIESSNMPDDKGDAMEPRSLSELKKFGEELGLSGAELREWIEKQQIFDRDERQRRREEVKEAEERKLKLEELKLKHEQEEAEKKREEAEKKRQYD